MRIVVLGASGFIGSAAVTRLAADGHEVIALSRHPRPQGLAAVAQATFDISAATRRDDWQALLRGADAVVNCAGTLQDAPGDSIQGVQTRSRHKRSAAMSPALARSIATLASTSASSANTFSAAIVCLLHAPRGRPAGLPLWPFWNCMPNFLSLR